MATNGLNTLGHLELIRGSDGAITCMTADSEKPIERAQMLLREGARLLLGIKRPRPDYTDMSVHNAAGDTLRYVYKFI